MKKVVTLLLLALWAIPGLRAQAPAQTRAPVQEDPFLFNHLSLGIVAGTDGLGGELAIPLGRNIILHGGYATTSLPFISYSRSFDVQTDSPWSIHEPVTGKATLTMDNARLIFDLFPYKTGVFHFSLGAVYNFNPNGFLHVSSADPLPIPSREFATTGIEIEHSGALSEYITTDPQGYLMADFRMGDLGVKNLRPYVGFGFGRAVSEHPVTFNFDLGVIYCGSVKAYAYDYINADAAGNPKDVEITSQVTSGYDEGVIDFLGKFPVYPVVKFSLFVKLF